MSPNVQEVEGAKRKRSHEEYVSEDVIMGDVSSLKSSDANGANNMPTPRGQAEEADGGREASQGRGGGEEKKEREDQRLQKLAEKAKADQEKQIAKAARAAEKAKKDAEEQEAKAAKALEKEEKRKKKEDEERKAKEEKEKKERSQLRLHDATPIKVEGGSAAASPLKKQTNEYERMFQPFFVKEHVRMAQRAAQMDKETLDAKAQILDEYVEGRRGTGIEVRPFNPVEALHLARRPKRMGIVYPPVRGLMEQIQKDDTEARAKLRAIPMKLLCFRQDVRPPYYGTVTCLPHHFGPARLRRVARHPTKRVLDLEYDYDSEAEWQDDEPGDDLDDMDEEEEDLDDEDDMDGFLDDSEDAGVARRIFANTMEPESTGLCFEDERGNCGIDPFSTQYWEPAPKPKTGPSKAATSKATTSKAATSKKAMPPPPAPPSNAFEALSAKSGTKPGATPQASTGTSGPATGSRCREAGEGGGPRTACRIQKAVLANQKLSKMAIVEVLSVQIDGLTKADAKVMLDQVAERRGPGRTKVWELKDDQ
ncbi:unnamed protein product [Parascedosporium putredinis]|uniref:Chromatin assembly factor 1 subunit A n=1 Tax=Parascedosporium putredinis TaxID=1442378 RepID=A0A9P1GZB3_9PEZI|nr:unnamed protein product [Parascedosporium putredinis]CAI7990700.1 unnamed protein product [Parascedosporium putredinis]